MFANFSSALAILKNLDKIKNVLVTVYVAVSKSLTTLTFVQGQLNDTKLGVLLKDYLPKVVAVLTKVKEVFDKYGKLVGLTLPVLAAASVLSEDDLLKELDELSKNLDDVLK